MIKHGKNKACTVQVKALVSTDNMLELPSGAMRGGLNTMELVWPFLYY